MPPGHEPTMSISPGVGDRPLSVHLCRCSMRSPRLIVAGGERVSKADLTSSDGSPPAGCIDRHCSITRWTRPRAGHLPAFCRYWAGACWWQATHFIAGAGPASSGSAGRSLVGSVWRESEPMLIGGIGRTDSHRLDPASETADRTVEMVLWKCVPVRSARSAWCRAVGSTSTRLGEMSRPSTVTR